MDTSKFIKESIKQPRLTDIANIPKKLIETPKKFIKWNLNMTLIIFFVCFMAFFLYNCKYGMFRSIDQDVYPFSITK
jgi:hypothetical protein